MKQIRLKTNPLRRIVLALVSFLIIPSPAISSATWKCIIYGDTRTNDADHRSVLASIKANTPDFKFIINVGDVTANGTYDSNWVIWQNAVTDFFGTTGQSLTPPMYMSAPGNHDQCGDPAGLANWKAYLSGQKDQYGNSGLYFVFDCENARFIILDSYVSSRSGAQRTMLLDAIQNNPKTWLFAIWHHPMFTFGKHSSDLELYQLWGAPLYENGCDLIFVGHDHIYVRTKKLTLNGLSDAPNNPPVNTETGTAEVLTGNGGAPLYDVNPSRDGRGYMVDAYVEFKYGYTELEIGESSLKLRHILADGTVADTMTYTPNPKPSSEPPARISVTVRSIPQDKSFIVDDTLRTGIHAYSWLEGQSHILDAVSPQSVSDTTRWIFQEWSDGGTDTHAYTVPDHNDTLTVTYQKQYRLTVDSNHGDPQGTGWYNPGTLAPFSVTTPDVLADRRYIFLDWSGDHSGSDPEGSILMDRGKTIHASWRTEYRLMVQSIYGDPQGTGFYTKNSTAHFSVSPTETIQNTQYRFLEWSGDYSGTESDGQLLMNSPKTVQANWETWYLVSTQAIPDTGGKVLPEPPGVWSRANGRLALSAVPDTSDGFSFQGWQGDRAGSNNPDTMTVDTSKTVTAVFVRTTGVPGDELPDSMRDPDLFRNYPNPFNPETTVRFVLTEFEEITLEIRNTIGQRIRTLHRGILANGTHEFRWDGTDEKGNAVGSGIYILILNTRTQTRRFKSLLLR